jgi:rhodanese-related sulfurtransferase
MAYENIDPRRAKELLDGAADWIYLDVRTAEEFAAGHVPGAYNVPAFVRGDHGMEPNRDFVATVRRHFAPESKLLVGCAAGGRSARACDMLVLAGFDALRNVVGGFSGAYDPTGRMVTPGWESLEQPVERTCPPERSWDGLRG